MKASLPFAAMMGAAAALAPAWPWAQTPVGPYGYGPGMMGGWGGPGMFLGPMFMILPLAVVIVIVVLAVRWLAGPWQAAGPLPPGRTALDILSERFARGEIDQTEYEAKRRLISQG